MFPQDILSNDLKRVNRPAQTLARIVRVTWELLIPYREHGPKGEDL